MKASKEENTAPIVTDSIVKALLKELGVELGIESGKNAKCSAEQYGGLIVLSLHKLGLLPAESIVPAMQAWSYIPKNPSAMRQLFEAADKETTSPAVASIYAKYATKAD